MASLMVGNEPSGRWMRQSAVDNPRFRAAHIGNFFGWKSTPPAPSHADLREPPKIDEGARLFKTRCAACHTVGKGGGIGPDLAKVTKRRDHCWVGRYISDPDKMLQENESEDSRKSPSVTTAGASSPSPCP